MTKLVFAYRPLSKAKLLGCSMPLLALLIVPLPPARAVCSSDDPVNSNPIKRLIRKDDVAKATLVRVASGMVAPNWGIAAPGDGKHLFVTDTVGKLWAINLQTQRKNVVLDVTNFLVPLGLFGIGYDERGLLGVAFHPDYQENGLFYTYTSEPVRTDEPSDFPINDLAGTIVPDHRSVITEWKMDDPAANRPRAALNSRRVVMRIDQPQFNHNGGAVNFGKDRMLYITVGDGGRANDQGAGHNFDIGNGQDKSTVLGKILRINPLRHNAPNGQYGVPVSNPFAASEKRGGEQGCKDGECDEIWAYGFRNPYRFSMDSRTGALIGGDAGQNKVEEIDVVVKGGNYGWRFKEGRFYFLTDDNGAFISDINCAKVDTEGFIDPIAQYDHLRSGSTPEGIAVLGGFVYRGQDIAALQGKYLFGDYSQQFAQPLGRLFYINGSRLKTAPSKNRVIRELRLQDQENLGLALFGFGQDANGELYVMGNTTGVPTLTDAGKTGVVMKLVPAQ